MGLNNNDRRIVNNLLTDGLEINKGENGKKSIKIIKNNKVLESRIKLDFNKLNTNEKIAKYINDNYI